VRQISCLRGLSSMAILWLATVVVSADGQRGTGDLPKQQAPRVLSDSLAGRDSFELYCAPCHGSDARGQGPVAPVLKTAPPDLTQMARRNGGEFPADRVRAYVTGTGRTLPAHGPAEMPIWGPLFRAFETDVRVQERIKNLVQYLASLQRPSSGPGGEGARLFSEHCASCHGPTGTGNGPMAERFRQRPPDLTLYTTRNGGVFPSEQVGRIIDGRDVPPHRDREMPVWGNAFRATPAGLSPEDVKSRIAAIVAFLEAIQRRNL
jgi:mono/diheme cytochrome c family protein